MTTPIPDYLSRVEAALRTGDATEHTHRAALATLLESLGTGLTVINEPKQRTDCGAPDLVVRRRRLSIGYLEAKDVGKDLDAALKSDQLKRYLRALPNLILTDYLSFIHFVNGERRATARLATWDGKRVTPTADGPERVTELLTGFLAHDPEPIGTPRALADAMARLTHLIRDIVLEAFRLGRASQTLTDLREAFAKTLIPELSREDRTEDFVDMYAQTLAYGLFAARIHHDGSPDSFTRFAAARDIPRTNPMLRRLFETLTGSDLDDEPHANVVSDLVTLLAHADMDAVLKDFGKRTRREDPIVHFYETFLKAYDPQLRVDRGVYYTPAPVVDFIVRSVDAILRRDFGVQGGLADSGKVAFQKNGETTEAHRVLILDPACGTGTFLYHVVDFVRQNFRARNQGGMWSQYVGDHLLPRLFGFELLMAPYAVAHLKLGMQLAAQDMVAEEQAGYTYGFDQDERLQVYLTNTLEEADRAIETLFGPFRAISDEARAANRVKLEKPIMAIIGNPPYSNFGRQNDFPWIQSLVDDWKPAGERKWNRDDYMKFMRWAQWRIEQTGHGVLAFITRNTYLDAITLRTMRASLMDSFDDIYVLDLHGDMYETSPTGEKDENVFDITRGVAIGIFVKRPGSQKQPTSIRHAEVWGSRELKYDVLMEKTIESISWSTVTAPTPNYLYIPQDEELATEFRRGIPIPDLFSEQTTAVQTARDSFALAFTDDSLEQRLSRFTDLELADQAVAKEYGLRDSRGWKMADARRTLAKEGIQRENHVRYLYRPFDFRKIYYSRHVIDWPRPLLESNVVSKANLGFLITRSSNEPQAGFCLITDSLADKRVIAGSRGEAKYFPLYLYPDSESTDLFESARTKREINLSPSFITALEETTGWQFIPDGTGDLQKTIGPEDVLHYAYAVFHSPVYRSRYEEFLRIDYPRLPLTSNADLFRDLCRLGAELVDLHLLRRVSSDGRPGFPVGGSSRVEKGFPKYIPPKAGQPGRVQINPDQYFDGIDPETWEFRVGGYQVLDKWLKDRRERELSYEDLEHYTKTAAALARTREVMLEVDGVIEGKGGWPMVIQGVTS